MDEKRAIVAVVLIFVVLFGFNYYQSQQRQRMATEQAVTTEVVERTAEAEPAGGGETRGSGASPGTPAPPSGAADEELSVGADADTVAADRVPERLVTVETPLWTGTLSTRGGAITSWELKRYRERLERENEPGAPPVSLVAGGGRGLDVSLAYGLEELAVSEWAFETDAPPRIELTEDRPSATLRFRARGPDGITVERTYTFHADSYAFEAGVEVSGLREPSVQRELWIGWPGVRPTEVKEDRKAAASVVRIDGGIEKDGLGRFKDKDEVVRVGDVEWVTSQSRYFMAALSADGTAIRETRALGDREAGSVGFKAAVPLEGESAKVAFRVYAGPQDYAGLSAMGIGLERAIDMGWSFTRPLSVLVLRAVVWAHRYIPNYGLVIILFSVLTKLLFYRLTHKSFTEMKRMQDVQPKLNALKDKYANDKEALAKAQMELYKKEGVNPLGSCLPMILQMPVFIALFQVLRTTIELRGAPFMLWITDLSQPDTIATIAGFPIHVLPLLMGLGMLLQQRFTTTDPSQAGVGKMMPILFTVLFYNFASGLVIYWLVNTVLSIGQQYYIHKGPSSSVEVSSDGVAPGGVREGAPTTVTAVPAFEEAEAEVVADDKPASRRSGTSRKRRRRKKK